jgi:hypothetical protein
MSTIRANIITDRAGTGAPNFPEGIQIGGSPSIANRTIVGTADQITVTNGDGADGDSTIAAVIASKAEAEAGTNSTKLMTSERTKEALNAGGSAPTYAARAWVNFDGTTGPGTIRGSGNVSSVARNTTGNYTVNFTTAMSDANYSVVGALGFQNSAPQGIIDQGERLTSSVGLRTNRSGVGAYNESTICIAVIR